MSQPKQRTSTKKASQRFTAEERAAMRERAKELKAAATKEEGERDVLAKIAEMPKSDRELAEGFHRIITETTPELAPRTWYGMPAYAKDDKVLCHFQSAEKFKTRYATIGFSERANLDDGAMWPVSYALTKLTAAEEKRIRALVKQAIS